MLLSILFTWSNILSLLTTTWEPVVELVSSNIKLLVTSNVPWPLPIIVYSLVILINWLSWIPNTSAPIVSVPINKYPGLVLSILTPLKDTWYK